MKSIGPAPPKSADVSQVSFLPLANEVQGQGNVFTHLSFCPGRKGEGEGLCMMSLPVWLPGPMFLPGRGICVSGPMFLGDGVSVQEGGGSIQERGSVREIPLTETPTRSYGEERAVHILLECFLVII